MSQPARKALHPLALVALVASVGCASVGPDVPNSGADEVVLQGAGVRTLTADGQIGCYLHGSSQGDCSCSYRNGL